MSITSKNHSGLDAKVNDSGVGSWVTPGVRNRYTCSPCGTTWTKLAAVAVVSACISCGVSRAPYSTAAFPAKRKVSGRRVAAAPMTEAQVLAAAEAILDGRIRTRDAMHSAKEVKAYLRLKLHGRVAESFCCLWLNNRHEVLSFEELFQGTIDSCNVHPREVVRAAMKWNAAAVVFAHSHPSGLSEPSAADRAITHDLKDLLALIGVRVLDHIIAGDGESTSMAERGLL